MGRNQIFHRPATLVLLALVGGNVALAIGPWMVRSADVGPSASAFWRMALAVPFLFFIARQTGQQLTLPRRGLYWAMILSGIFFALDLAAWHIGLLQTKLANATLFGNLASVFFPIWGYFVARSLPSRIEGFAFALAIAGTALLLGRSAELSSQTLIGDVYCLAAGIFYTIFLIAILKAREEMNSWVLLAWSTLATAPPLWLIAWGLGEQILPTAWTSVILLAIISQLIGQGLMVYVLGKVSNLLFGLSLLIGPVVSALIGWLVYDEMLTLVDAIGAVLIATGLVLVSLAEAPTKA